MYLKRLELSGFKSFADRTKLDFVPGINTIVGPNGCGKSNTIDALRWVLGEQKYSILRSKSMEEVVFAGTGNRKPSGMAQVSLVFDNTDGLFAIDAPEVSLTRRAFREGSGRYLINNRTVRLKDVHELVADTGLGSGALFVLSAQEIDRVLSNDSFERRSILEETAGINKYQLRKKDTLAKLKSVKENVSRLNDILQEVARQVEMSEKQLKKLNRYRKIKERLTRLEISLLKKETADLESEIAEFVKGIEEIEEIRKKTAKELEVLRVELTSLETERERCKIERDREKEEYSKAELEEEKLRGSADLWREKIRQTENSIEEYKANGERVKKRIEDLKKRIEENRIELEAQEKQRDLNKSLLDDVETEYRASEETFNRIRSQTEGVKSEQNALSEKIKILTLKKEHADSSLVKGKKELEDSEKRIADTKARLEESARNLSDWETRLEELTRSEESLELEMKEEENRSSDLQEKLKNLFDRRRNLREDLHRSRSEAALLAREEESFRGFSSAFQTIMKRQRDLPEMVPVHSVIRVGEEYETAADITLGGHFQSIITRDKRDANTCVNFLKRERAGRLTFFPLDLDRRSSPLPSMPRSLPGIVGWAKDLIETEPRYRDIIDMICGRTLIVKDLDSAYRIYDHQKRNRAFIPKMVTLDGDVLEFSGAVTGGKYRTDRSQLLSRRRKKEELEEKMPAMESEISKIEQRIASDRRQVDEFKEKDRTLRTSLDKVRREKNDISSQLKAFKRMQVQVESDFAEMEDRSLEIMERIDSDEKAVLELTASIDSTKTELEKKNEELQKIEEENSSRLKIIREITERRALLKRRTEEYDSAILSIKTRQRNDEEYLHEYEGDLERIGRSLSSRQKVLEEQNNSLRDTLNKGSILKLRLKSLKRALDSSLENFYRAEENTGKVRLQLTETENRKSRFDHEINEKRIGKIELDSKMRYLKERLSSFPSKTVSSIRETDRNSGEIREQIDSTRNRLSNFDGVNFSAEDEYNEHKKRYDYLQKQIEDLQESSHGLRQIIKEMDRVSLEALEKTLEELNTRFKDLFVKIFGGGMASIFFTDADNKLESGIDIEVQPPGKRTTNLSLLSTGEKSLTAVTFLFALLSIKPGPLVILDELDAPLDESNVEKIAALIRDFSEKSQFLVVTHNRKTMEFADTLIGVTMEEPGISKLVSVKFDEIDKVEAGEAV